MVTTTKRVGLKRFKAKDYIKGKIDYDTILDTFVFLEDEKRYIYVDDIDIQEDNVLLWMECDLIDHECFQIDDDEYIYFVPKND